MLSVWAQRGLRHESVSWALIVETLFSIGDGVRFNIRSLPTRPILSWVLLHFNEHATHHHNPRLPWYRLPAERRSLPAEYQRNDNVNTLGAAVLQQLRGPFLWERLPTPSDPPNSPIGPQFRRVDRP